MDNEAEKTATAELVRGRVYVYRGIHFHAGEVVPVTEKLADELEELFIGSTDSRTRERLGRKRFKITRGAETDTDEDEEVSTATRKRAARRTTKKPSRSNVK